MKLGVYVGSFNPVHKGHKCVIDYLLNNNYLDKIIVIPTEEYWNKTNLISLKHRIEMLKTYEDNDIKVSNALSNVPYTYQILEMIKKQYIEDEIHLIIGADNIVKFHLWEGIDEILKNKVIVLPRNGINIQKHIEKFQKKDNFILIKNFKSNEISSEKVRELISKKNFENLKKYLDTDIIEYIVKNKLYIQ